MTAAVRTANLGRVAMLSEPLPLHDIEDTEAFCRAVIHDHLAHGVRTAHGLSGPSDLSPDDRDELLQYLIVVAWRYSQRYHGIDDGRGKLRFSGYVIGILHKRAVDWKRARWRSTRYLTQPVVETPYDDEMNGAVHHDNEPIGIDTSTFNVRVEHAYRKVCRPLAESGFDPADPSDLARFSALTSQPIAWVNQALRIVRAELEQQGIRPSTMQPAKTAEMEAVA